MNRISMALAVCTVGIFFSWPAYAGDWKWVAGNVQPSGWRIQQGAANTEVRGEVVSIVLHDETTTRIAGRCDGRVKDGRVSVLCSQADSDAPPETLTGPYSRVAEGRYISESWILTGAWSFVVLARTYTTQQLR